MFCKKIVLKSFAKLTEKHLCQGLFYNKVAGLGTFLYRTPVVAASVPVIYCKIENQLILAGTHFCVDPYDVALTGIFFK